MIRLEEASKIYPHKEHEVVALATTSLIVSRGEFVAVVGPSGSGKTTLLSMLGGMLAPSMGKVCLDDVSLYDASLADRAMLRRQNLGFVFQTFNLIPYLSALKNVQVPLMLMGSCSAGQQKRVTELMDKVGLRFRLHHKPRELSVGQQQRVALARTLANDPPLILADEPTGNLDPETREDVLDFLETLCQEGRTVIMVTHDPAAASRASRVIKLVEGSVTSDSARTSPRAA